MEIEPLFRQYLKEDEQVLWTGQPKSGVQIRDADMILIPMSIILLGFSVILGYTLLHYQSSIMFKILGIFLAMAFIYIGLVRFFADASKRARTFYCVTTKRVIVKKGKKRDRIKTLPLRNIERMDITEEKDGSGFIIFGNTNPLYPWLFGGFYFTQEAVPGLELLPDVHSVYNIISDQIKVAISPSLINAIKNDDEESLN